MTRLGIVMMVALLAVGLAAPAPALAQFRTHVVQPGENLYRIALKYGIGVDELMRANGLLDPRQLRVGQVLVVPPPSPQDAGAITAAAYVVQRGDTLYSIAKRSGVTVRALMDANGLVGAAIYIGQTLIIPPRMPAPGPISAPVKPQLLIGTIVPAPRPLTVRSGPRMYDTTVAVVSAETPLRMVSYTMGWFSVTLPSGETGWVREVDLAAASRPTTELPRVIRSVEGRQIVAEAMKYLGTAYVWGGESDRGVDCSGFVYVVLSAFLPGLPRMSSFDYFKMGIVLSRDQLEPGDLVFFTTYAPGPSHVGIYVGDGRFIQASSGARRVVITGLDEPYYAARYVGARRLTKP